MQTKKTDLIKITIGLTLNYFLLGIPLLGLAFYFAFIVNLIFGIPFFYFGFLFLISIQSIVIDPQNKMIKKYYNIYPFKIGSWKSIQQFDRMVLELAYITNSRRTYNDYGVRQFGRTKSFDVYFSNLKNEKMPLVEFDHYVYAKRFLDEYAGKLNLIKVDTFEEALRRSSNRRY